MKIKHLFCIVTFLCSFMACSQDDVNHPQGGNENEEGAYMSLAVAMPNGAAGTRGIDEGTDKEEGTDGEQKITNLTVLCYNTDAPNTIAYAHTYLAAELTPQEPNPSTGDKSTTYIVPAFEIASGVKKVVVIVNPISGTFGNATTLATMRSVMEMSEETVKGISTNNQFLMTNANTAVNLDKDGQAATDIDPTANGEFYADGSVYVDVQGTAANPTQVTIPVERAVAKIMDVTHEKDGDNDYVFTVKESNDQVTFTHVALVNANKKFYPIKNIRNSEVNSNDYVVDPNFTTVEQNVSDFYFNNFTAASAETDTEAESVWKELTSTSENSPIFYCLENTMIKEQQMNGYTTGLYYKAVYKVANQTETTAEETTETTSSENVYKYLGKVYNFSQLGQLQGLNLGFLTDNSSSADFAKLGITKYTNGVCYYPYWIRHVPSGQDLDVMEFAVVRNNVYKMTIHSVSGIGTPTPENPDPENPDETSDVMLQVLVKVLPWTVRNNSIDF